MVIVCPSNSIKQLPKQEFLAIINKVNELTEKGIDIINLSQGNPDLPTPPHIVESLRQASLKPLHHKYSPFRGHAFLKEAISSFYKREYGVNIDPNKEVAIFNGGKAALYSISQSLLDEDDIALIPDPGYPEYLSGILMSKATPHYLDLQEDNGYLPVYKEISPEVCDKAKLMYLNYPSNPTGASANLDFFEETVAFAEKNNINVIHDFAYGGLGLNRNKPVSFLQARGAINSGIEIYTMSKSYNMAGWRVAFAVGNEHIINAINDFQDHVFVSLFGAIQEATKTALLDDQSCLQNLNNIYKKRIDYFVNRCKDELNWSIEKPKGSFYIWAPIPKNFTSYDFTQYLLENAHVAVTPGEVFGKNGAKFIRISMIADIDRLDAFIERIKKLNLVFNS
ncbi:aminotransferase class I/II-fold pyridoxal phosphate-dependent enzyme [Bacillus mycoides]|uniref:aminotransferase class I/II-fold pyridoxal phosphate-dependent enzyme n=1 Tax=Bacillus mycoides TaxID=1405 RepID=UPI0011A8AA4F|nr:aminotransferase class I/II-fold pyridoxal phosphate-dependent enzyme [Bacillus mycoides]